MTKTPSTKLPTNVLAPYQVIAASTAEAAAYSLDYLIPGIVGEVGELFGQKAKAHWHGWKADKLQTELVSEYGDVAWMTAILLQAHDVHEVGPFSTRDSIDQAHLLLMRSTGLHLYYSQGMTDYIAEAAARLWAALEHCCESVVGVPFAEVLAYNEKKLADRAARGVLKGAGDHR